MKPKSSFRSLILASSVLLAGPFAHAVTYTWSNADDGTVVSNGNWSSGTSWTAVPVSAADTTLSFGWTFGSNSTAETNTLTNDVANPFLLNILTFGGSTPTAGNGTFVATLNIAGSPLNLVSNGGTTPIVNLSTSRSAGQGVAFNVQSNVALVNNTLFTGNGTGTFNFSGQLSGSGVLTKGGTSALTLSGDNSTYSSLIALNVGTINITTNNTALGTGTFRIGNTTGTTAVTVDALTARSITNALSIHQDFTYTGTSTLAQGTGAITLANGSRNITVSASTLTLGGMIGESTAGSGITKLGAGTLALSGANNFTGAVNLGTAGSLASAGTLTVSGASGTINAASGYSVTGSGSRLLLDNTAGNVDRLKDSGSAVTLRYGGELSLTGNGTNNSTETITSLALGNASGIVTVSSAASRVTSLAVAGGLSRSNFSTGLIRGTSLSQSVATNVSRITLGSAPTGADFVGTNTLSGGATNDATQALKIIPWLIGDTAVAGTGTNFLTYDSTLGLRVLNATEMSTLAAGSTTAAEPVNAVAFNGTVTAPDLTVNSLLFNTASQTLNGSGTLAVDSGAVAAVANTQVIGSGFSGLSLGNGEGVVTTTGANVLTINTPVSVTSGGLTKAGGGTLVLGASNLYAGQTTVNQGTLQIGTGTAGDLGSNTSNIVLNGGNLTFGRTNAGLTVQNDISGVGSVTQSGSGNTTLSGNNTYTGTTTIGNTGGVLIAGSANAIPGGLGNTGGTGVLTINDGILGLGFDDFYRTPSGSTATVGRVQFSSNGGFAAYGADRFVNFGGSNNVTSGGIVAIGSTNTGNIGSLNGKTFILGASTATHKVTVLNTLDFGNATRSIQVNDGAAVVDAEISGKLQPQSGGSAGLNKSGAGSLTLSGANTINGTVAIQAGQLNVATIADSVSSNLGIGTSVVIGSAGNTAILNYTGTGSSTARVVTIGSNSTTPLVGDTGGATIQNNATNGGTGLKFTAANFNATGLTGSLAASRTLTLGGSNTDPNEIQGIIADGLSGTMATALTKDGTGKWTLTNANSSYTGATTVNQGTLVVNGNISTSILTTVKGGATIAGNGGTVGALTIETGGFINPGSSPGILNTGNFTQAGLYTAEIAGTTPVSQYDQISVTGAVDVTGGSLAAMFSGSGYADGNLIFILLNDGGDAVTGTYAGLAQGATVANYDGLDWQIYYDADSGANSVTGGNDIALFAVAIPEPRAALLGALGLLALLRRKR